jgi:hypothetical protein
MLQVRLRRHNLQKAPAKQGAVRTSRSAAFYEAALAARMATTTCKAELHQ